MVQKEKSLMVFVYNADSGFTSPLKDYVHKVAKPSTYQCNICALTYGNFGMKKSWKDFIYNIDVPVEFLHRDEFMEKYSVDSADLPAVYLRKGNKIREIIDREDINRCESLDEFIALVSSKLRTLK